MAKDPNKYPKGFDRKKIEAIIEHYDNLSDDEWIKEIEAAAPVQDATWVKVPNDLLPKVKQVLQSRRKSA